MTASLLGVEHSLGGRRWLVRAGGEAELDLARAIGDEPLLARLLAQRGVSAASAPSFIDPTLKALLPDPSRLADMDKAAARLAHAIADGEPIAIFADYDVDGATAAAVLARFLAALSVPARVYVPDRMAEGYGPNAAALLRLKAEGIRLVITVDCGIAAHAPLAVAAEAGLEVIVVDHHLPDETLPIAHAIVNPNRADDESGQGQLAAVGVAFLLAVATNRTLRHKGWFKDRPEPDLKRLLDVVALGTVCDMVPLTGVNRALVIQGLKVLAATPSTGLAALMRVAGVEGEPRPSHLGFQLGPRINAGGRVGEAGLGARLLLSTDPEEARGLAQRLDALNAERRRIEAETLVEAEAAAAACSGPIVLASGDGWHAGVVGIVASRLVERFHRPAFVVAFDGDHGRGSARGVDGVDVGGALQAARASGHLISGGGHKMAGGFALGREKLAALAAFLSERIGAEMERNQVAPTLMLDGAITARALGLPLAAALARLEPYGVGNPEPRFALAAARVVKADTVGEGHVRCILADDGGSVSAIAFRSAERPLGEALRAGGGRPLHLAGRLKRDSFQGRERVQFQIEDGAWPG